MRESAESGLELLRPFGLKLPDDFWILYIPAAARQAHVPDLWAREAFRLNCTRPNPTNLARHADGGISVHRA